jgi:hypothetical protein
MLPAAQASTDPSLQTMGLGQVQALMTGMGVFLRVFCPGVFGAWKFVDVVLCKIGFEALTPPNVAPAAYRCSYFNRRFKLPLELHED